MDESGQREHEEPLNFLLEELSGAHGNGGFDQEQGLQQAIDLALKIPADNSAVEQSDEQADLSGTRIGQYQICERIGSGGMGVVYRARHLHLSTNVAIKILPDRRAANPISVARFEREMRLQAKIDHANVVSAMDGGVAGGQYFVVMKYIEGVDAARTIALHGLISAGVACEIVRQAALGLQHLHEHNMIHRDVKPANMIVGYDGVVRLIDFGLARVVTPHEEEALTRTDQVPGTISYMAPEQLSGRERASRQSDIYSLGAALHYLLTGRPPDRLIAGDVAARGTTAHNADGISASIQTLLAGFLASDPGSRFATAADAAAAAAAFANPEGLTCLADQLQALSVTGGRDSFLDPTTIRLGESGGPTTSAYADDKDDHAKFGDDIQPARHGIHLRKRLSPGIVVALLLPALAIVVACFLALNSNETQDQVEGGGIHPGDGQEASMVVNVSANAVADQILDPDRLSAAGVLRDHEIERRVAAMLLERGGELLLYPTKRVRSVAELPDESFVVLNVFADRGQITDDDCRKIGTLKAVKSLQLSNNPLSGAALQHFSGFEALQWLYLGSCPITDAGMRYLLPHGGNLKSLDLSNTGISSAGLRQLTGFRMLRELLIADNDITDVALIGLERFPSLLRLNLSATRVTDVGVRHLATCTTLKFLDLDDTSVTDDCLDALLSLKGLTTLSLRETAVSDDGMRRLRQRLPECEIAR